MLSYETSPDVKLKPVSVSLEHTHLCAFLLPCLPVTVKSWIVRM